MQRKKIPEKFVVRPVEKEQSLCYTKSYYYVQKESGYANRI